MRVISHSGGGDLARSELAIQPLQQINQDDGRLGGPRFAAFRGSATSGRERFQAAAHTDQRLRMVQLAGGTALDEEIQVRLKCSRATRANLVSNEPSRTGSLPWTSGPPSAGLREQAVEEWLPDRFAARGGHLRECVGQSNSATLRQSEVFIVRQAKQVRRLCQSVLDSWLHLWETGRLWLDGACGKHTEAASNATQK